MSTPPKNRASSRSLQRAISQAASRPGLVSMMTCRRVSWPRSLNRPSSHTTSSGVRTFGSISAGGGVSLASTASTSARPNASRTQLMRTMRSTSVSAHGSANNAIALDRATALSFGAMPSSSSTQTTSAPQASALGYIVGSRPGEKMKLRRGRTVRSVMVCPPFARDGSPIMAVPRQWRGGRRISIPSSTTARAGCGGSRRSSALSQSLFFRPSGFPMASNAPNVCETRWLDAPRSPFPCRFGGSGNRWKEGWKSRGARGIFPCMARGRTLGFHGET